MYLCYTIFFCVAAVLVFWHFIYYGKSMVWKVDGLYQHYNAFIYLGSWCRDIIQNLFYEHKLVVPLWEWGLGLGSDVITTLSYYVFGDPFALVSVITPIDYGEQGYAFSIILRFFMAGIAFCIYARKMKCERWCSLPEPGRVEPSNVSVMPMSTSALVRKAMASSSRAMIACTWRRVSSVTSYTSL